MTLSHFESMRAICPERLTLVIIMDCVAIILIICSSILSILFIYRRHQSLKATRKQSFEFGKKPPNLPKPLYILMVMLLIDNIGLMVNYILYETRCYQLRSRWTFSHYIFISIQPILLILLWYIRLRNCLSDSVLSLSKYTMFLFTVYLFISAVGLTGTILTAGLYVFEGTEYYDIFVWTQIIALSTVIIGITYLAVLFVYKLMHAYKYINNDQSFISVITRFVILNISSITMTAMVILFGAWYSRNLQDTKREFIYGYIVLFDGFTNCLCTLLSFIYFEKLYWCLCSCAHRQCDKCWLKIAKHKQMEINDVAQMTQVSSLSTRETPTV